MAVKKVTNEKVIAYDFCLDLTKSSFLFQLCTECGFEVMFIEVYTLDKRKTSILDMLAQMDISMVSIPYKHGFCDVAIKTDVGNLPTLLETLADFSFEEITVWNCYERWEQHLFLRSARRSIVVEKESDLYLCYNHAEKIAELYLDPHYDVERVEQLIKKHAE